MIYARFIALALCAFATAQAEIQLRSVLTISGKYLLAFSDSEDRTAPRWVFIGGKFGDYTLIDYDSDREIARLKKDDTTLAVRLVAPRAMTTSEAKTGGVTTPTDEELVMLGLYRIAAGDSGAKIARLANLTIGELLALNPGVEFAKLKVGQILTIAKEPNQPPEPTR